MLTQCIFTVIYRRFTTWNTVKLLLHIVRGELLPEIVPRVGLVAGRVSKELTVWQNKGFVFIRVQLFVFIWFTDYFVNIKLPSKWLKLYRDGALNSAQCSLTSLHHGSSWDLYLNTHNFYSPETGSKKPRAAE